MSVTTYKVFVDGNLKGQRTSKCDQVLYSHAVVRDDGRISYHCSRDMAVSAQRIALSAHDGQGNRLYSSATIVKCVIERNMKCGLRFIVAPKPSSNA